MKFFYKKSSGYIALLSVLMVSAITSATVLILLATSLNSILNSGDTKEGRIALFLADACAELALQRISNLETYPCTSPSALCGETITLPNGTCEVVNIANLGGGINWKIKTFGTNSLGSITKFIEVNANRQIGETLNAVRWVEVVGF